MNEVGLDPGMDHMSAMSIIDEVGPPQLCFCFVQPVPHAPMPTHVFMSSIDAVGERWVRIV